MATSIKELWKRDYDEKIAQMNRDRVQKERMEAERTVKENEQARQLVDEFMKWVTYTQPETTSVENLFYDTQVICYSSKQTGFPFFAPSIFTYENQISLNLYPRIVSFLTIALVAEGITVNKIEFSHFDFNKATSVKIFIQYCGDE